MAAGADYRFTPEGTLAPDIVVGGALGWGGTGGALSRALGTGRSSAVQAAVYGAARNGPVYATAAITFANHWVTTNRFALGDHLLAHYSAQSFGGRIEGGWRLQQSPDLGLTPYAAVQLQDFETPAYSETDLNGGGLGLAYKAASPVNKQFELGLRFDHEGLAIGDAPLVIRGRAAWAHDWSNGSLLGASFEALPGTGFLVRGAKAPGDSGLASLSAELPFASHLTFHTGVDGQFGGGTESYTASGSLRFTW
jgi:outer membrane autotransporter protein